MKVQAHSSSEPPLAYNQDQTDVFDKSTAVMTFLTILGVKEILCRVRLFLEGKTGKYYTSVIKITVFRKVFSKQFRFIKCKRPHFQAVG